MNSEQDYRGKCYTVEPRTVVPGMDWHEGDGTIKKTDLSVVVEVRSRLPPHIRRDISSECSAGRTLRIVGLIGCSSSMRNLGVAQVGTGLACYIAVPLDASALNIVRSSGTNLRKEILLV